MHYEHNKLKLPEKSYTETALQITKSSVDIFLPIPILGPAISQILGNRIESLREERSKEYSNALHKYIAMIPQKIIESSEFAEAMRIGVSRYVEEPSEKKRQFILNLNRSLFTLLTTETKTSPFDIYFIFNDLFDQISLPALDCLVHFQEKFKLSSTRYDIINFFNELHGVWGKRAFEELVNNAFLEEEGTHAMPPTFIVGNMANKKDEGKNKPIGQKTYKIQPLGALFSDWLKNNLNDAK